MVIYMFNQTKIFRYPCAQKIMIQLPGILSADIHHIVNFKNNIYS